MTGEIVRVRIEEFTRSVEITFLRSIRGCSSQILSSSCMSIALRLGIVGTSSHQIWKLFGCSVHLLFVRYSILFAPLKVFLIISVHHICQNDGSGLEVTAGQRTMSGLIVDLTGQIFVLPVMLTGQNSVVFN